MRKLCARGAEKRNEPSRASAEGERTHAHDAGMDRFQAFDSTYNTSGETSASTSSLQQAFKRRRPPRARFPLLKRHAPTPVLAD